MRFWKLLALTISMGIIEDFIAIWIVTDSYMIDGRTIGVVLVVATVFAVLLEWLHKVGVLK